MSIRNEVVVGIRSSLDQRSRVQIIERYIADGCSLAELNTAFTGTRWRYYLKNCGLRIEVADIAELEIDLRQAVERLCEQGSKLVTGPLSISDQVKQTFDRNLVLRAVMDVIWTHARVNQFLFHEKVEWTVEDPISECLRPHGFKWNSQCLTLELATDIEVPSDRPRPTFTLSGPWSEKRPWCSGRSEFTEAFALTAISVASDMDDGDLVGAVVENALHLGIPLTRVAQQLRDKGWRYRVTDGGNSAEAISIAKLTAMYRKRLAGIDRLVSLSGIRKKGADLGMQTVNVREALGSVCKAASMVATSVNEHLLPDDSRLREKADIRALLKGTGLAWDGDRQVERFRGEHQQLIRQAAEQLASD